MYENNAYGNGDFHQDTYQQRPRRNGMARASLILGILSVMFCSFFYISLPCGALAILCALLSRTGSKLASRCKAAIVCGICGICATVVITSVAVKKVFTDPLMRSYLEYYIQAYTGDADFDLDDYLSSIFPFLNEGDDSDHKSEKHPEEEDSPTNPLEDYQEGENIFL